ncbi:acyl carrier protein [Streptomyces alboflavus]|nr:acyl carrier protein [Streptomyces alboflavus]
MSAMHGRLVGLLVDRFDVDPAELAPGTTFDDLDTDSPYLLEQFLVALAALGVAVGEHTSTPRGTIGAVVEVPARRAGPGAPAPPPAPVRPTPTPSAASTPVS